MGKKVTVKQGEQLVLLMTCQNLEVTLAGDHQSDVSQFGEVSYDVDEWNDWTYLSPFEGKELHISDLPTIPFGIYFHDVGEEFTIRFTPTKEMTVLVESIDVGTIPLSTLD
ncbi:MAG: hypothetical protein QY314_03060 [Candidatus Dojkabacteria bacterium]|nr:MAG: hypothetical protein QY314_03060 [Candidatus Dojkabacteria bacterium]